MIKNIGVNLFRCKGRVMLTVSGIAVGVFSVVLISAIGDIGTKQVSDSLADMGINSVLVQSRSAFESTTLSSGDVDIITRINGVDKAMPLMAAANEIMLLGNNISCYTWGINSNAKEIISLEAKYGRLINAQDVTAERRVCVIDEDIAVSSYGRGNIIGKTARILIGGSFYDFEIIGVASSGLSTLQAALSNFIPSFVYIPFTTMQTLTGRQNYDKIAVLINENAADKTVTSQIEKRLNSANNSDYIASNLLQQKNQLDGLMKTVTVALSLIAGISLFVSGLTVMTTMLVAVGERKREIGIKKSVGAKNFDILTEFLAESVLLSLLGSVSGALIALAVTWTGCALLGFGFIIMPKSVIIPICISLGMGIMFGVYPAAKAAGLPPIEALR